MQILTVDIIMRVKFNRYSVLSLNIAVFSKRAGVIRIFDSKDWLRHRALCFA